MIAAEVVTLTTIGASLIGIVGFVLGNARSEAGKRSRIYGRIDEVKEANNKTYVKKEVCDAVHKPLGEDLKEVKDDVKKLLQIVGEIEGKLKN